MSALCIRRIMQTKPVPVAGCSQGLLTGLTLIGILEPARIAAKAKQAHHGGIDQQRQCRWIQGTLWGEEMCSNRPVRDLTCTEQLTPILLQVLLTAPEAEQLVERIKSHSLAEARELSCLALWCCCPIVATKDRCPTCLQVGTGSWLQQHSCLDKLNLQVSCSSPLVEMLLVATQTCLPCPADAGAPQRSKPLRRVCHERVGVL